MLAVQAAFVWEVVLDLGCSQVEYRVRQYLTLPSVKVSPEAHSTPNMATISPALACEMSSRSLACMRTKRGTCTPHTGCQSQAAN